MADNIVSKILIKSSTSTAVPSSSDLQRAELAYSYASDRLFIGNAESGQPPILIGGNSFLALFEDVLSDDGTVHAGTVYPNNVIVADANNHIDFLDFGQISINGRILVTKDVEEIITANNLPNVADNKLVSSKAIKDYVDERTKRFLLNFDEESLAPGQILVVDTTNKFENREISGVVEFFPDGSSSLRQKSVTNLMLENDSIRLGLQEIKLGEGTLLNLNQDTSGVLDVHRGGTGGDFFDRHRVLLGNDLDEFQTSARFFFDTDVKVADKSSMIENYADDRQKNDKDVGPSY